MEPTKPSDDYVDVDASSPDNDNTNRKGTSSYYVDDDNVKGELHP